MRKDIITYCCENLNISKRLAKKYILNGKIEINGKVVKKNQILLNSDTIKIDIELPNLKYELNDYLILKKNDFICLDKKVFMHTERISPEDDLTIEDIVVQNFPNFKLISRLDFETDGILTAINKKFKINNIEKKYLALVNGVVNNEIIMKNKIDAKHRKKVKVSNENGENITTIKPLKIYAKHSLVEVYLKYASRHQIRAYLSHINFPIVGDNLYGNNEEIRLMLHCKENTINGINVKSKLTENFKNLSEHFAN